MSLKRSLRSAKPNNTRNFNIKRERLLTREENQSVSEWLSRTEAQSSNTVKTVTLQQPTAKGVLLLNCTEKPDKTSNRVLNQSLNLTEKKIYARFEEQRLAGIIMTPDEICECARTIHTELLQSQAEQLQLTKGKVLDVKNSKFDASEEWFQQFCARYNVPWRPHVERTVNLIQEPTNSAKLVTETTASVAVTKKPSPSRPISILKLKHNKKNATATNTNTIGHNKVIANTETITKPTLMCKREARQFIRDFHEFMTEGGYLPSQVFNAAEMFLNWKLMPECARIYKIDRYNSGGDRLSLLFCGNASGDFLVKPMFLHHTWSPKIQDESHLPLYVPETLPNTPREFIRAEYFFEWLQNCFIPEVRDFLQAMNLPAKALLLIDAGLLQGHSELPVSAEDNFVEFLYFPEQTASLLQPISMTVMPTFACNYLWRLFSFMVKYNVVNRGMHSVWAQFTMTESLLLIQQSIEDINAACWNSGWTTIWKEIVREPFQQNLITSAIKRIAVMGRQIPYEGLRRMTCEDIEKHLKTNPSLLPAFQVRSAGKHHLNWLDSDNDSEVDETVTDLDKNPFLLKNINLDSDEVDEDEVLNFENITVECNAQQENKYKSELNSPTPTTSSRLPSISDCETPPTPEFDLSMCNSDLSSPTPSENYIQDIDSDCSAAMPTIRNSQLKKCRTELAAFKSEVKSSVVNKIDNITQALKSIPEKPNGVRAIRSLHKKLDLVVNELSILKSQCAKIEKKASLSKSKTQPQTELHIGQPFETAAEFIEFDENLQKSNNMQEQLTSFFHTKLSKGTNLDKGIEEIWRTFLTDTAACEFVWKRLRTSDRCPVKDFKFSELLISFFMENIKGNISAFDAICARSFTAAHERWRKQHRYPRNQKKR